MKIVVAVLLLVNSIEAINVPCTTEKTETTCTNKRFQTGDRVSDVNSQTTSLTFDKCTIRTVYNGLLEATPSLQHLYLIDNEVESIEPGSLNNLKELTRLDFDHNRLTKITKGVLNSLSKLETFYAIYNRISEIEDKAFVGLEKLTELYLHNNQLKNINEETFGGLKNLVTLDLENNKLETIEDEAFSIMSLLDELDLAGNQLDSLTSKVFSGLSSLTVLNLNNNLLQELPVGLFKNLNKLIHLDLSHNRLVKVTFGTFTGLNQLEILTLHDNKLAWIYEQSFKPLKSLQILDISNNLFDSVKAEEFLQVLPKLKHIHFNGNDFNNCSNLSRVVLLFEQHGVNVTRGFHFDGPNYVGIACDAAVSRMAQDRSQQFANDLLKHLNIHNELQEMVLSEFSTKLANNTQDYGEVKKELELFFVKLNETANSEETIKKNLQEVVEVQGKLLKNVSDTCSVQSSIELSDGLKNFHFDVSERKNFRDLFLQRWNGQAQSQEELLKEISKNVGEHRNLQISTIESLKEAVKDYKTIMADHDELRDKLIEHWTEADINQQKSLNNIKYDLKENSIQDHKAEEEFLDLSLDLITETKTSLTFFLDTELNQIIKFYESMSQNISSIFKEHKIQNEQSFAEIGQLVRNVTQQFLAKGNVPSSV